MSSSIYDYPKYYDLVYGSDWKAEVEFLEYCFENHALVNVRQVFEPACGTGRLLFRLAKRGFEIGGLDINEKAVDYCNKRLSKHGIQQKVFVGDMCDFQLSQPIDAAFNTINSFRHLETEQQSLDHMNCMTRALKPGGLYVLGIHLSPPKQPEVLSESWSARQGHLAVTTRMWLIESNKKQRYETFRLCFDIHKPTGSQTIQNDIRFRTYTKSQILNLIKKTKAFEIAGIYDFAYEPDEQIELNDKTEDVIFVLRKKT